ncbi:hypothetical protein TRM7557_02744 [Tritonibacter multivorans]|uniref:Uncharacterized protein n=1 Tax=Tritonibacter multivorans TaxID=928856 RepID=A0A0P1GF78_9RHOB|nr:hypothetical protein [Tritonibacter multivorans]MDA7421112.1 hypothetical protein [Tritonibacter multivorans]CUH80150.1 hypothetical protein TRM7557_02744 [Tritonibacter multivorans]SFC74858.1 hypothetical protein SAMN04488049_10426 [Tritonibacter multivorans]
MPKLDQVLKAALTQEACGWTMGSFGAIAEFHHVVGDPAPQEHSRLLQVTDRGGVRIDTLDGVRPVAYETLSPRPHRWTQAVSLCLPRDRAAMNQRRVLTCLGPDHAALRDQDRGAEVFDMGLGQYQVDFCIRTQDPVLLEILCANEGKSLFDPENPAMGAILKAHPHRIALTRLGRVEVYQMIGGPDTGGTSPEGPHTHVLPKLLRADRTHSANTPIPEGWVPCCGVHPENPVMTRMGADRAFDKAAFDAFQELLATWGADAYLGGKLSVWELLKAETPVDLAAEPATREGRAGWRNGMRQWRVLHGSSDLLERYAQAFDRSADQTEPENPGH